jgi:alkylhydroperoxidase family enzyme
MSARFQPRGRDELDPDQRSLHDRIVDGPRRAQASLVPLTDAQGRLVGPFGPMTIAPGVGDAVQQLGASLRFATAMCARTKEAAILLVAARRRCVYEWMLHEGAAVAAGIDSTAITALRAGRPPGGLGQETDAALAVVDRLLDAGALTDGEYTRAMAELGEVMLAELVWLVGYYSMLALALGVFEPPLGGAAPASWEQDEPD